MRKTVFIKGVFVIICLLVFFPFSLNAQCYGPTTTGNYTNGTQPTTNSNYFINHVFSTFSSTGAGSLNGNNFTITKSGSNSINLTTATPGETLVTGTSLPSSPSQIRVGTGTAGVKITFSFTSDLPIGTHFFFGGYRSARRLEHNI